jgi:FkbM family methyltransferase
MGSTNMVGRRMNNPIRELQSHYSLFGIQGVLLLAVSRLLRKRIKVRCSVPLFPHALHLRLRTSDITLFGEILLHDQYDWELPAPPQVIVDAGANIGLTSVFYANRYPQAKIIAIEPEPSNFEMLRRNTALYPNIIALRAALWNKDCNLDIVDFGDGVWDFWGFRTRARETSSGPTKDRLVRGLTLDSLMKENDIDYIDLLKLDIEGAEKEIFEKPAGWIHSVGALAVELHDRFREGCSDSVLAATADFEYRCNRGETTFIARHRPAEACSAEQGRPTNLHQSDLAQLRSHLPLKVWWAV